MNKTVAVIGAGGKMGARAAEKIGFSEAYRVLLCESNAGRAEALEEKGLKVTAAAEAMAAADFVVMAVPDAAIGAIGRELAPLMKRGGTLIMLDAAAAYIGELPPCDGITQMITHPCHPPFFTEQATAEARRDYFGGVATQDILVSLIGGSEEAFEDGTRLCRAIFAPVNRALRVTPEQFAMLEPGMSEIVVAAAANWMKESMELAIEKGVPREAAEAFMAGHAQIAMAIVFGAEPSPFSDAAQLAIQWGTSHYINPEWRRIYERETLAGAIHDILKPRG
ncbi:MAG: NAD(P)-binding domain-containing protein [Bryobacteraceae bacterium]|nr:NAD(P)-binding domain-containing protein [Bryobacteraceae bacterium]